MSIILEGIALDKFNHEDVLREKMLAFERMQVKAKLRPPMPCDLRERSKDQLRIERDRGVERRDMFRMILHAMPDDQLFNCEDVAEALDTQKNSASNFLKMMVSKGYLHQIPHTQSCGMQRFIKTGNTP